MPSPFNGKWRAVEVTGGKEFVEAVNSPEAYRVKLRALIESVTTDREFLIDEYNVNEEAGTVHRQVHIKGHSAIDFGVAKFGVEEDGPSRDGRPAKVKVILESPNKMVRSEIGDGFTIVITSEVNGDRLTATSVGNGVTNIMRLERV